MQYCRWYRHVSMYVGKSPVSWYSNCRPWAGWTLYIKRQCSRCHVRAAIPLDVFAVSNTTDTRQVRHLNQSWTMSELIPARGAKRQQCHKQGSWVNRWHHWPRSRHPSRQWNLDKGECTGCNQVRSSANMVHHQPCTSPNHGRWSFSLWWFCVHCYQQHSHPHSSVAGINSTNCIERQLVNVKIGHQVVVMANIYQPPTTSKPTFRKSLLNFLTSLSLQTGNQLLVFGDFNLQGKRAWTVGDDFLALMEQHNMKQIINPSIHHSISKIWENINN